MRATAAVIILAAFSLRSHAHTDTFRDVTDADAVQRLLKCVRTIGPSKCLAALGQWRAENALNSINDNNLNSSLEKDIENFPWENYANSTDDELYSGLCIGTEKLLQYKSLHFNMLPGYEIQLASRGNGSLNIEVFNKPEMETSRGMKKIRKVFYNIVPYLLLPGLIMSAILPFMLPALKMMTMAAVMINNMALSGAVFTLLRNNAFNDKYDKKVIYVNEGYVNEKHANKNHDERPQYDFYYEDGHVHSPPEQVSGSDVDDVEVLPGTNNFDWVNQYNQYGNKFVKVAKNGAWGEEERGIRA